MSRCRAFAPEGDGAEHHATRRDVPTVTCPDFLKEPQTWHSVSDMTRDRLDVTVASTVHSTCLLYVRESRDIREFL